MSDVDARPGLVRRLMPADPPGALPERVRARIREQQDRSEILIGWAQLAIVATFAALYWVSPKTFAADMTFAPVPWALGAYTAFTLLRLGLAYRWRLPPWFLALSVLVDMALLMSLIWSFHLQYGQPPSFYLKAPTLLYVFIFIALRALRFEAGYVVLAGVAGALGWVGLAGYAILIDPSDDMITRDYVAYMTSNLVLLGAEFDKVVSILVVTAVLAVAIARARRLLERSIAEDVALHDMSRFFAPEIAEKITSAEDAISAGRGELRRAAILAFDIRGFTRLAERVEPDALMDLLAQYQARVVPSIQAHGGSVDKFLGDGILATFGAAAESETWARDALAAAHDGLLAIDDWNRERVAAGLETLDVRCAVAEGTIVFGAVGDESRLEYTVIGDAVNLAAKLEKQTKAENVRALATRDAYLAAVAQGWLSEDEPEVRPGVAVEGVAEPVDLVVLAHRAPALTAR